MYTYANTYMYKCPASYDLSDFVQESAVSLYVGPQLNGKASDLYPDVCEFESHRLHVLPSGLLVSAMISEFSSKKGLIHRCW